MHGFIRGLRQIFFISALFVLSTITFTSCSVFRTLGLYNVPPPYSESYEEYHGKPLLHLNKAENISMHLSSEKKSYYPGEPITIICTMINHSKTDTMGVNSPFSADPPYINIKNSNGQIVHHCCSHTWACPLVFIVDEYDRRLNVSYQKKISPNSQIEFTRRIDRNYYNNKYKIWSKSRVGEILANAFNVSINGLIPDVYKVICYAKHTEFDEMNGPKEISLQSDTLEIEILKPTDEQIQQRNEYMQIMKSIENLDNIEKIYTRCQKYVENYPDGNYIEKIKKLIDDDDITSIMEFIKNNK